MLCGSKEDERVSCTAMLKLWTGECGLGMTRGFLGVGRARLRNEALERDEEGVGSRVELPEISSSVSLGFVRAEGTRDIQEQDEPGGDPIARRRQLVQHGRRPWSSELGKDPSWSVLHAEPGQLERRNMRRSSWLTFGATKMASSFSFPRRAAERVRPDDCHSESLPDGIGPGLSERDAMGWRRLADTTCRR